MKCDLLRGIMQKNRTAAGHPELERVGRREKQRAVGQTNIWTTHYVCKTCRSKWRYESKKNDDDFGWSIDS